MFDFLKKRLKKSVDEVSKKIKEKPEKEIKEKAVKEKVKKETAGKSEKKIKEEVKKPEEIKKKKIKIKEAEEEPEEKRPRLRGAFRRITERKLSERDIDDFFKDWELELLQNNVALEVIDHLKSGLKERLAGRGVKRTRTKDFVSDAFKDTLLEIVSQGEISLEGIIDRAKSSGRPACFVFLGFNGSGKCVSGDAEIFLSNGKIEKIEDLYKRFSFLRKRKNDPEGEYVKLKNGDIVVYSVNPKTLKFKKKSASRIWKLGSKKLYEITLENGLKIKTTPEHPFFSLRTGYVEKTRADDVKINDFIMVPKSLPPNSETTPKFDIEKVRKSSFFVTSPKIRKLLDAYLRKEKITKYAAGEIFGKEFNKDPDTFHHWYKNSSLPVDIFLKVIKDLGLHFDDIFKKKIQISWKNSQPVSIPIHFGKRFSEWLGLFCAEGHFDKSSVDFTNNDAELLNRFKELTEDVFGLNAGVVVDKRKKNLKRLTINNKALKVFLNDYFDIENSKENFMDIVSAWPQSNTTPFLRGLFAGDAHFSPAGRCIEISTRERKVNSCLHFLLLRYGVLGSVNSRKISGKYYFRNAIFGHKKFSAIGKEIGFINAAKKKSFERLTKSERQFEKTELIPLQGKLLKELRLKSGLRLLDISNELSSTKSLIHHYEGTTRVPCDNLYKIISLLKSNAKNEEIKFLKTLANSDVSWLRIRKIKKISNKEPVYDLTVPEYENFVANGIVVHNTTTIARVARYLLDRKKKVVLAAGDTWRSAAIEQLEHHGNKLGIKTIKHQYGSDSAAVVFDAIKYAQANSCDIVLADTAGRTHVDKNLMDELTKVIRVNNPDLKILVVDSLTGNDAVEQAKKFHEAVGIDCSILTKTDVNTKGGSILSVIYSTKKPILFLGTGQDYSDLKPFSPEEFVKELI